METIQVRKCLPRDLVRVTGLLDQLREVASGAPLSTAEVEAVYQRMEANPEIYLNLVAEMDGQIVGFLSLVCYQTLFHRGGTALINELVVDETARGQGIGAILVREAREEALARGLDELEVATEQSNRPAQAFYRKAGFTEEYVLFGMEFESPG